jgi:hypothetical protein
MVDQPGGRDPVEHATPTTLFAPHHDARVGLAAVLAAACDMEGQGPLDHRVALVHLHGLPRAAVIGLAGLTTTELTMQALLRQAGSALVQVKSSDAASLESQLIDVRSTPLDLLVFTGPARQTAERLMAGGGLRGRTGAGVIAFYNGPAGEHTEVQHGLGPDLPLRILPSVRVDTQTLDARPTEQAIALATREVMAADTLLAELSSRGFTVETSARALTRGSEALAAWWRADAGQGNGGPGAGSGSPLAPSLMVADLGGRYAELAVVGSGAATRTANDLAAYRPVDSLGGVTGRAEKRAAASAAGAPENGEPLEVADVGRWLPYDWTPTGLGDTLANYLRRPFVFPSTWGQLLMLMALGRERLARLRGSFRGAPGDASLAGDWRRSIGRYVISGGYVRHLPSAAMALALAVDGLEPTGVTEVWCDRWGRIPYLATLGRDGGELAGCLERLATVVSPAVLKLDWRRPHDDDILALVTVERGAGGGATSFRVVPGSLMRFPLRPGERAKLTIHPLREHDFGAGAGRPWRGYVTGGRLGLVFDGRGRPIALPADGQIRQAKLREWLTTLGAGGGWGAREQ